MGEAFFWGLLAGSSLVIGGLIALTGLVRTRLLGLVMAFGAGVLISAVAYELVQEAFDNIGLGRCRRARAVCRRGSLLPRRRCHRPLWGRRAQEHGRCPGVRLGTTRSSWASCSTAFPSRWSSVSASWRAPGSAPPSSPPSSSRTSPEAIAATSGLLTAGWRRGRILGLWTLVMLVTGLASLAGYALFDTASDDAGRVHARLCRRRRADDAGRHDDAGGVRARRQARWPRNDARLRSRLRDHALLNDAKGVRLATFPPRKET